MPTNDEMKSKGVIRTIGKSSPPIAAADVRAIVERWADALIRTLRTRGYRATYSVSQEYDDAINATVYVPPLERQRVGPGAR